MKIAVIFTGGTIGSTEKDGYIAPGKGGGEKLLNSVSGVSLEGEWIYFTDSSVLQSNADRDEILYEAYIPMTILSENSTGLTIRNITESIEEVLRQPGLDGVIVTHGTDTLVYTAAALGYLFAESAVPIVVVSSNFILDSPLANGWDNFRYGVAFLAHLGRQNSISKECENASKGVFVSYRNRDGVPRIHRGTAVMAHQAYSDEVYSVLGKEYGSFEKDGERCRFVRGESMDVISSVGFGQGEDAMHQPDAGAGFDSRLAPQLRAPVTWNAPILQIYPYPGMEYPSIPVRTKAILHHSYHSGTICTDNDSNAAVFFAEAEKKGIPVFLSAAYGEGESHGECDTFGIDKKHGERSRYESTKAFEKYEIITLSAASPVAMYMKLWLLADSGEDVIKWMKRKIPGDISLF
ncbi:MAG: asparaginase [Lachnospiraceae bacterium]|nr:asparaginase [Lachnospiraceae bacterium]